MKKHQTVQQMTAGQMKELSSALIEAIPTDLNAGQAQYWIGKKGKLAKEVKKILAGGNTNAADLLADWQEFYQDVFGIEADFSNLLIPEKKEGFDRLIVILKGMSPEKVFQKCKESFSCWKWTGQNLDEIVFDLNGMDKKYRRSDNETHAIWVRNRQEADEELKNFSASELIKRNIPGITLEARELYELKYFKETGRHLDIQNWTLCTGSRYSDGFVPRADWSDGKLSVDGYNPDDARDSLRSREVVS